jgi:hypothetical protein
MNRKKFTVQFIVLLLPMLIVSTLLNFLYSLNSQENTHINWFIVVILAIVLDAFISWILGRTEKKNKIE